MLLGVWFQFPDTFTCLLIHILINGKLDVFGEDMSILDERFARKFLNKSENDACYPNKGH